ncbi:MAG: hypothetical protein ACFNLY_02390 [Selenomonas noxia]
MTTHTVSVADRIDINRQTIDPHDTPEIQYCYVDIDSVENGTGRITQSKTFLGKNAPSRARRLARENDVLISTVRPNLKAFTLLKKIPENCLFSTGFAILSTKNKKVLQNEYIYAMFMYDDRIMAQLMNMMPKGLYPSINIADLGSVIFPMPPLSLQNDFAAYVESVDKLRFRK